jgi:hypothetical protein
LDILARKIAALKPDDIQPPTGMPGFRSLSRRG